VGDIQRNATNFAPRNRAFRLIAPPAWGNMRGIARSMMNQKYRLREMRGNR
jgi:hypothetical protein